MLNLRERIITNLEDRRQRVLDGEINCIPLPFERFRSDLPGIEQGNYILISGSTKSAKTQLTNYLIVYNAVLYSYYNPDKIQPKIFYYPLEETAESITLRFMAFLLNKLSGGKIRISPTDLKSTDERKPLSQEILDAMKTDEFTAIMDKYESIVTFYDSHNPTGVWKDLTNYAKTHGKIVTKKIDTTELDDLGQKVNVKKEIFDYYIPDNPNEYVFIVIDHISLLDTERGMTLRETMNKLSEYLVILRNKYNYIPVVVQQQSTETTSLDAFKNNKIRPTVAGLADSKYCARDCSIMIGITNPNAFELQEYMGYDVTKLKNNFRIIEVVINRNGVSNGICPLFFDGAINDFNELPRPNDSSINKYYEYARSLRNRSIPSTILLNISNKIINTKNHPIKKLIRFLLKIESNG